MRAYLNRCEWSDGRMVTRTPVSPTDRRTLSNRLAELAGALKPLSGTHEAARASAAIGGLLAGFPALRTADAKSLVDGYLVTLADLPAWAIERACLAAAREKIEGLSPDFAPTAARLHQIADTEMQSVRGEMSGLRVVLSAEVEIEISDAERRRVAERMRQFADDFSASVAADVEEDRKRLATLSKGGAAAAIAAILDSYRERGIEPVRDDAGMLMRLDDAMQAGLVG